MTNRPGDRHVLHPGDKVMKIGDYNIPGEVRCRFIMTTGVVRYAVEHKAEGGGRFVHIYADKNLELVERGFEGKREDSAINQWRSIETAPTEPGTQVDLWLHPIKRHRPGERGPTHRVTDATLSGNGKHWIDRDGKYVEGRYFYDEDDDECFDPDDRGPDATVATHWMPLPEPPK